MPREHPYTHQQNAASFQPRSPLRQPFNPNGWNQPTSHSTSTLPVDSSDSDWLTPANQNHRFFSSGLEHETQTAQLTPSQWTSVGNDIQSGLNGSGQLAQVTNNPPFVQARNSTDQTNNIAWEGGRAIAAGVGFVEPGRWLADRAATRIDQFRTASQQRTDSSVGGIKREHSGRGNLGSRIDPRNVALAARHRAELAAAELRGAPAKGSALKMDPHHNLPTRLLSQLVHEGRGQHFTIQGRSGYANLTQVEGKLNGQRGVFEWIVQGEHLTHQRFIPKGRITGFPNQNPKKLFGNDRSPNINAGAQTPRLNGSPAQTAGTRPSRPPGSQSGGQAPRSGGTQARTGTRPPGSNAGGQAPRPGGTQARTGGTRPSRPPGGTARTQPPQAVPTGSGNPRPPGSGGNAPRRRPPGGGSSPRVSGSRASAAMKGVRRLGIAGQIVGLGMDAVDIKRAVDRDGGKFGKNAKQTTTKVAGGLAGGAAGAAAGAAIGAAFGGVGAVPGAAIGFALGTAGSYLGSKGGEKLGKKLFK